MGEISPSRYTVTCGWDDVPHLDEKTKRELLESTQPYLREARSKGIPSLGSGAIYPVPVSEIACEPFQIPAHWKRAYGMDVGWRKTSVIWIAEDPEDGTRFAYSEYYRGEARPPQHAEAVRVRGDWIRGAIDPAARGRGQDDGKRLFDQYRALGLNVIPADNSVESGIYQIWSRLETGRMRVFSTLQNLLAEYRLYRRDERGRIVKEDDHAMDAWRYGNSTFDAIASVRPMDGPSNHGSGPANSVAGY